MAKRQKRDGLPRLIAAADQCFFERPYAEVGIADVLDKAGVKPPSLYYHFGDKEGLFVSWAERALAAIKERNVVLNRADQDPIDRLVSLASAIGDGSGIDYFRTLDSARRLARPESTRRIERAYFEAVVEPVCLALMAAQDAGRISIDSLEKSSSLFISGAVALSHRSIAPGAGADSDFRWLVLRFVYGFVRPLP